MAIAPEHHNPAPPAATAGQESNVSAVEEMKKQAQAQVQAKEKENANEKEKAEGGVEEVKVNGHVNGANGESRFPSAGLSISSFFCVLCDLSLEVPRLLVHWTRRMPNPELSHDPGGPHRGRTQHVPDHADGT